MKTRYIHPANGFTLAKLLVVIVIIATLAALSMMGYTRMRPIVVDYDGSTGLITQDALRRIDAQGGRAHPFWKANH